MLKRTLISFVVSAFVAASAVALASDSSTFPDGVAYSAPVPDSINALSEDPAPTCGGDLNLVTYDLVNGDDWVGGIRSTDAAASVRTISTQEPYAPASPPATAPTNTTGGNLVLAASNGGRRLGSAGANGLCVADPCVFPAGQTITIPVQVDGVATSCQLISAAATAAASREFLCDGQTPAVCGANIVTAASTVSPCSLMTVVSANKTVSFSRKVGSTSTSYLGPIVASAAGITAQNGADGGVVVGGGTPGTSGWTGSALYLGNGGPKFIAVGGEVALRNAAGSAAANLYAGQMELTGPFTCNNSTLLGWHVVSAPNQSCETTCTKAAVFGWDGTTPVNHDDATADICLCAGAN